MMRVVVYNNYFTCLDRRRRAINHCIFFFWSSEANEMPWLLHFFIQSLVFIWHDDNNSLAAVESPRLRTFLSWPECSVVPIRKKALSQLPSSFFISTSSQTHLHSPVFLCEQCHRMRSVFYLWRWCGALYEPQPIRLISSKMLGCNASTHFLTRSFRSKISPTLILKLDEYLYKKIKRKTPLGFTKNTWRLTRRRTVRLWSNRIPVWLAGTGPVTCTRYSVSSSSVRI